MSKLQRSADAPANPSTQPPGPIQLNEKEEEVLRILNKKKKISDIDPKKRSEIEKTYLKKYNNQLNKFGKDIVERVLKKCPELQKKAMTGAEQKKLIENG